MEPEDLFWVRIFVEKDQGLMAVEFYNMNENQAALLIAMATRLMKTHETHKMVKDNEWEPLNKFQKAIEHIAPPTKERSQ